MFLLTQSASPLPPTPRWPRISSLSPNKRRNQNMARTPSSLGVGNRTKKHECSLDLPSLYRKPRENSPRMRGEDTGRTSKITTMEMGTSSAEEEEGKMSKGEGTSPPLLSPYQVASSISPLYQASKPRSLACDQSTTSFGLTRRRPSSAPLFSNPTRLPSFPSPDGNGSQRRELSLIMEMHRNVCHVDKLERTTRQITPTQPPSQRVASEPGQLAEHRNPVNHGPADGGD